MTGFVWWIFYSILVALCLVWWRCLLFALLFGFIWLFVGFGVFACAWV